LLGDNNYVILPSMVRRAVFLHISIPNARPLGKRKEIQKNHVNEWNHHEQT